MLSRHGYQRPGTGAIFNDCYGAQRVPHEISRELADEFLESLRAQLLATKKKLQSLARCKRLETAQWNGVEMVTLTLVKGECDARKWDQAVATCKAHLAGEASMLSSEIERVEGYLVDWAPKPLRSAQEELSATTDERAARKTATQERHRAAFAKALASVQKRIDSALRSKNSRTLAEIWEDTPQRLQGLHPPKGSTRETLLAAIERDHVWAAFKLSGEVPGRVDVEHPTRQILDQMYHRRDRLEGWHRQEPWGDGWHRYLERMTLEWPAALDGESPKGAATLAEVQTLLKKSQAEGEP